ncbi:phage holin family protein [Nocardia sp. NBC_00511]|uniref:phage holin family protein n=1 Tax=Nocardia sp. NBC_00511 TaxID=2903591 RepID=UPI0030E57C01
MTSYRVSYGSAVDTTPGNADRLSRILFREFIAWLAPLLRRAGRFLFAEALRGVIAAAALGFAVLVALFGASYFFDFVVELLDHALPHWAALLITATGMLIPAALAALFALWQVSRMRTVRTTAAATAQAGAWLREFTRTRSTDRG